MLKVVDWAPLPEPPKITEIIPTARTSVPPFGQITTHKPSEEWTKPGFDASLWKEVPPSFGTVGTPARS